MTSTPKPSELIGTSDAAAELGVDTSTLTRWIERGWIEPVGKLAGPTGAFIFNRAEVARVRESQATIGRRSKVRA